MLYYSLDYILIQLYSILHSQRYLNWLGHWSRVVDGGSGEGNVHLSVSSAHNGGGVVSGLLSIYSTVACDVVGIVIQQPYIMS